MDKLFKNLAILILFLIAMSFIFFTLYIPLGQDEGVFLTISKGILQGLLPYRDFFDHKPPGIYFLFMPINFLIECFFSARLFSLVINIVTAFFVYKISENLNRGSGLTSLAAYLFIVYIFEGYYLISEPFIALILTFIFYLIIKGLKDRHYFVVGLLMSLAFLFKQQAIISVIIVFLFIFLRDRGAKNIRYLLSGILPPFLVLFLWLFVNNISGYFIDQVFFSNFYYPRHNFNEVLIRVGTLFSMSWYFWLLLLYFILYVKTKYKNILLLLIFLPMPLYFIRDYAHYWILSLPFLVIASSIAFNILFSKRKWLALFIVFVFILTSVSTVKWYFWMYKNVWKNQSAEQSDAKVFINSLDSKYIFAENRYTSFYVFSNKEIISKYLYITEITNHYNSEQEILEKFNKVEDIVILWPNDGNVYSKEIENYIKSNFKILKVYPNLKMNIYKND
jgi:hypothetical protein